MDQSLTISQLDPRILEWIKEEARRTGQSPEAVARQLIARSLDDRLVKLESRRHHDLDFLAGTWDEAEAAQFLSAVEAFSQIDLALWK